MILARGGFKKKPWVFSGTKQSCEQPALKVLPNQISNDESRALGLGYDVEKDEMYIITSINFSKKIQKMRTGPDLLEEEIQSSLPENLTKREILSQLMGVFDPAGLVSPAKMKGSILFKVLTN